MQDFFIRYLNGDRSLGSRYGTMRLAISMLNHDRDNNIVEEVNFNGEINVNPNLDYFLVMVNTPQKFEGWETFDYKLKLSPKN